MFENNLFYDKITGTYFNSQWDKIVRASYELDMRLSKGYKVSINDYLEALGLKSYKLGDEFGWKPFESMREMMLSEKFKILCYIALLNDNETPVGVIYPNYIIEQLY